MSKHNCINCQLFYVNCDIDQEVRICNRFKKILTEKESVIENNCKEFLLWFGAVE